VTVLIRNERRLRAFWKARCGIIFKRRHEPHPTAQHVSDTSNCPNLAYTPKRRGDADANLGAVMRWLNL
jgi:hypothetical protein